MPKNPKGHVKPTKAELAAQVQEAIDAAEKLKDAPPEVNPEEEAAVKLEAEKEEKKDPQPTPVEEEKPEEEEKEVVPEEEQAEPSEEEKEALKQKLEDEKKKSSASARENQKIYAKNRVINKALADAEDIPEPTDEEMAKEFTDWDVMSDTEKVFAKETVISRKWRKTIAQAKEQATKIEKWNESVETFISDPSTLVTNPDLEGKTEEFKTFATQEANNSVPIKILVSAFLHEQSSGKKPNKGKMFERASGGSNEKPIPKSNKITLEEARQLRETNYDKWREYLAQGKIETNL